MSKIEQELVAACDLDPRGKTTELLARDIIDYITQNPTTMRKVSVTAMNWVCDAIRQVNEGFAPPDYPDEGESDERFKQGAVNRKKNLSKNSKGAAWRAKEIMVEEGLSTSLTDVHDRLLAEGYEYSMHTLQVVCTEFRNCIKFLDQKGYLAARAIKE